MAATPLAQRLTMGWCFVLAAGAFVLSIVVMMATFVLSVNGMERMGPATGSMSNMALLMALGVGVSALLGMTGVGFAIVGVIRFVQGQSGAARTPQATPPERSARREE